MGYRPEHFELYELVPEDIYNDVSHNILWGLFDDSILRAIDELRDRFGPAWINNWYWGGDYQYSGLRPFSYEFGAKYSLHKYARAFDIKFNWFTALEVRRYLKEYPNSLVTRIENKVNWLHIDRKNTQSDQTIFFNP